jgi:protein scribble
MQELVLTDNYISELPSSIGDLTMLTNFNVDRNRLEYLPPQIGNLVNMGVFSLRENQLRSVPSEIGTCKELHVLDVSGNRLQHLPFTLTNLNLKALWLAENQAKPMLNFQTDYDEATGEQVLTCFLLPQMEFQQENMGLPQPNSMDYHSSLPYQDADQMRERDNSESDQEIGNRQSVIKFKDVGEEDDELRETAFVRQKTPHPKELKAKAHKLFGNKKPLDESKPENELNGEASAIIPTNINNLQSEPISQSSRAFFSENEPLVHEAVDTFSGQVHEDEEEEVSADHLLF